MDGFGQVFGWQLEALPNAQKVVVDITEDISLLACISVKTLELVQTGGEWRDNCEVTLLKPAVGPPFQEDKGLPHLFLEERDLLLPPGCPCKGL
jgi:hypothetical protein